MSLKALVEFKSKAEATRAFNAALGLAIIEDRYNQSGNECRVGEQPHSALFAPHEDAPELFELFTDALEKSGIEYKNV